MSYGSLVSIESSFEVDTSNLDERLDSMQETIDTLESATPQDGAFQVLEERIEKLEGKFESLADLVGVMHQHNDRLAALEESRTRETNVVDLLRQLARALVG